MVIFSIKRYYFCSHLQRLDVWSTCLIKAQHNSNSKHYNTLLLPYQPSKKSPGRIKSLSINSQYPFQENKNFLFCLSSFMPLLLLPSRKANTSKLYVVVIIIVLLIMIKRSTPFSFVISLLRFHLRIFLNVRSWW